MTQDFGVKVQGLNKVQRMLNKADANKALIVGILWGMTKLIQEMEYPPVSEANYPNAKGRWYQRGYGTKYIRKDGSIGGRETSHPLKDGWKEKLFRGNNPKGVVSNTAPYSPYVQGDPRRNPGQAKIHQKRGWKSLPVEGKKLAPKITKQIIQAFKRRLT
jgi:hypothetical protein